MKNPKAPNPAAAVPRVSAPMFLTLACALAACLLCQPVSAQVPDLTNGGVRLDNKYWNLGPTGMTGWVYRDKWTTKQDGWESEKSRQIEVTGVDAGSPADGILQVGDVILGADGTGADPVAFTADARKSFASAISDAEANDPAALKMLVWRAGSTSTTSVTLETLGAYSATAPYNCPKSAAILEKGLDAMMLNPQVDKWSLGLLTLLAGNDPANPDNPARMAKAQEWAHKLILSQANLDLYTADAPLQGSSDGWHIGFKLTALAEYYLATNDPLVYDSLHAYAIAYANGQSMFGTTGHKFSKQGADGSLNGPYGIGYGVINMANMHSFYGLVLANKAGINDQKVLDAIQRATVFYNGYVERGAIPYGEHGPIRAHDENGKCGLGALAMKLVGGRNEAANYYAKMSCAAAYNNDNGHQGPFFNYLWAPLGANVGGEECMAAYFAEQRWRFELARNWDGTFTYNSYYLNGGQGTNGGTKWNDFHISMTYLLPYAVPLRQTYATGREMDDPNDWVTSAEVDAVEFAIDYDAAGRTTNELVTDLESWSIMVRDKAAAEIGVRTAEHAALLPGLHAKATDTNEPLHSRMGACKALGAILDDASVSVLAGLLTDPDRMVKSAAANALQSFSKQSKLLEIDTIMAACAAEDKPVLPIDGNDPIHLTHREIIAVLFDNQGALSGHDLVGLDRDLLLGAIRATANHPQGATRSQLSKVYPNLTRGDVEAIADTVVLASVEEAPADRMFAQAIRIAGGDLMQSHNFAEGVPISMMLAEVLDSTDALDTLIAYAGNSLLVEPDHKVLEWLDVLEASDSDKSLTEASNWPDPGTHNHIQWVRDAILGDPGPYEAPEPFKGILAVYADDATLALPGHWTGLHANAYDFAKGDSIYTWRKVHGAGGVSFHPNGTAAAKDTAAVFDGTPGEYLFEVKVSDSRGFTEVSQTVAVTLEKAGGGLDPNSAPVADDQSLAVAQGTPTQVMLTGSDPEAYPLVYTVTNGPVNGTLSGTAPSLVYTASPGYTGSDSISFEVMDSEGQVDGGTVSITVGTAAPVGLAIYEPFEGYPLGTSINGLSGTGEVGLDGTWTAGNDIYTEDPGYTYGPLPTTGARLWHRGLNNPGQSRPINPDALANSGLLNDGATLWFSMLIGADDTYLRNVQIALSNAKFGSTKNYISNDGTEPGTGIGFELNADKQFYAVQFFDSSQGTGDTAPLRGDFDINAAGQFVRFGDLRLVVGKITWGAASDTVEMYLPLLPEAGEGIMLPDEPSSTLIANVDQSKFDVLTLSRGQNVWVDEIRFGATLQSVMMGTVDAGGVADDGVAPAPDPMTFAMAPTVSGTNSITMTATPAYDPLGVEYYFTCTAGGGNDSGWQESNAYTDAGLTPGSAYTYTVKARDKTPGLNETAASAAASATIPALGAVPDVVGIERSAAEALLAAAGMTVGTVTDAAAYSLTVPAGHVLGQSPAGPVSAAYATAVDLVISIGQDPSLPTLASVDITDDTGGHPVTLPAIVTYTLAFSQDMDAATLGAGDFTNLAGMPIAIGSIAEVSPGVFEVEVIPDDIDGGVLLLAIVQGAVIKDAQGNSLNTSHVIADDQGILIRRPGNYLPVVDAGPDQTVSIDSPQPWSPSSMPTVAWFDAADAATITQSGGTVSQWDDKSGNGNHAAQGTSSSRPSFNSSDPLLNGMPTIGYDQAYKFLTTDNSLAVKRAYFVTYYDQPTFGSWHNAITNLSNTVRFAGGQAGQNHFADVGTQSAFRDGDGSINYQAGTPAVLPMAASVWTFTATAANPDRWRLLGGTANYTGWQNGALGEVILTDGTEDLETQQKVEGYLAHKWGLTANLAANHPYKSAAPTGLAAAAVLDGTVSDSDNDALATTWSMVSGPQGVSFADGSAVDTTAVFATPGTYVLRLTADDTKAVVSDQVTVNVTAGGDTTPPALAGSGIVDDQGGADVTENEPVNYIVTFSEDMDAATVDASDFGNAGTSAATVGAVTETSPGVFSVGVIPTTAGSLQLQVSAGAVLTDLSGNPLDTSAAIMDDTVITVLPESSNTPPSFAADPFGAADADEGAAYSGSISASATDPDAGDTLTFSKSGGPAWLGIASDGTLSGTPGGGDVGANAFTVGVSDGNGGSDSATLEINVVAAPNTAPVVSAGPNQTVALAASGAWTPESLATVAWYDAADTATITQSGGGVSQWSDKSGNGNHATQSNSSKRPVTGTKSIGGLNVLDFEVTASQSFVISPIDVVGKEVWAVFEMDDYSTSSSQLLMGGGGNVQVGVNSSSQNLRFWKAANAYSGDTKSTATVPVDTATFAGWLGHTDTKKYSVNGVLQTTGDTYVAGGTMPANNIGRGQYAVMDGSIGELIVTPVLSEADRGKMEGYLAHKWGLEANLPVSHPYKASPPTGGSPAAVVGLDGTVTDADTDPYTSLWSVVSGPAGVAFGDASAEDTTATFTEVGSYVLELEADDGTDQGSDQVTINVHDGSDTTPPTLAGSGIVDDRAGANVTENDLVTYTLTFSEDMDAATVDAGDFSNAGTAAVQIGVIAETAPGVFSVEVTPTSPGTLQLQVSAAAILTDFPGNALGTTSAIVDDTTISVDETNVPPAWDQPVIDELPAAEDAAYSRTLADHADDANAGDTLAFAKLGGPAWLSVAANGDLTGTPTQGDVGVNVFTVTVTDGVNAPVEATINIEVLNTNDAPVFADAEIESAPADEDTAYSGTLDGSATDADGDDLAYAKLGGPAWLGVSPNGSLTGTPGNGDVGSNVFTIGVSDGNGGDDTAILTINVSNTNDAPTWAGSPITGAPATEDSAYSGSLLAFASDMDADASLTFEKLDGPAWLAVAGNGDLSGTPANADAGEGAFTLSVSDGIAPAQTATFIITVENTNDAPTWESATITGDEADANIPYSGTLAGLAGDEDVGDTLSFALVSGPSWLAVASDGSLSGTPAAGDVGTNDFTVSVSDGAASATATLQIPVNAPSAPVYEPFDDADATLAGNAAGTGISGTWSGTATVAAGSLGYGDLPAGSGNKASLSNQNGYASVGATLGAAGLLDDGSSLWFSVLVQTGGDIATNGDLGFALGTEHISSGNNLPVANSGQALGFTFKQNQLRASQWTPGALARGTTNSGNGASPNTLYLVVGKFTWGASSETLEIYNVGTDLALGSPVSTRTTASNLDQTLFDTVSFASKSATPAHLFDEIRFGPTYESVIGADGGASAAGLAELVVSDIQDDRGGADVPANDAVTYAVSFSEDMDETTVDAADFSNAGTSAISIGSIVENDPGVFTVEVTPTTAGSLQLQVSEGAVLTGVSGNALDTTAAIVDDTVITVNVPTTTVPDVVGQPQATASASISGAGLVTGGVTNEHSATIPAGDVISQNPAGGATVEEGTAVDLVVSLGPDLSPKLVRTTVSGVSSTSWTAVGLGKTYNSPVIIATPIYPDSTTASVVTRIRNVTSTGFEIKFDRADNLTGAVSLDVSVIAVDEGVYTQAADGVTMEAVKFTSTLTARKGAWNAESRAFQNSYTNPVVVGQVMSANDANWSVFWSMGSSAVNPVNATNFNVGKHVGEDAVTTRADETIGYIVIEAGTGMIEGVPYEAGLGADTVLGIANSPTPYTYALGGTLASASAAAVSQTAMDGADGSWAVLAGATPISGTSLGLYAVEDQKLDSDRSHTSEQFGYIVFE